MLNDEFKNCWIIEDISAQIVVLNIVYRNFILIVQHTWCLKWKYFHLFILLDFECPTKDSTD